MLRLALYLLCLGLVLSRVGLLLHEGLGHGGMALALGGSVRDVSLFWFGGGWVRTATPGGAGAQLAVQLAGIGAELLVAAALAPLAARWAGTTRGLLAQLGAALLLAHGLWYAATGIWHGFGDGAALHELLGAGRYPVALALGGALCAVAALATRRFCLALAPLLPGGSPSTVGAWQRRLALVLAATVLAGGAHAALTYGELSLRRDETYRLTMRTAEQREQDARLAAWRAELARRGTLVVREEDLRRAQQQPAPPRPFPFAPVLAVLALSCAGAGAWSLRRGAPPGAAPGAAPGTRAVAPLTASQLAAALAAAVAAVSLVAVLNL